MRRVFWVTLVALLPGTALAGPLSFDAAIEIATQNAPSVEASRAGLEASRNAATAAGQLPDPSLTVGVENFPVSGPPAFSFSREGMTMKRIGIEQAFPNPAKRRAQVRRAETGTQVAGAELAVEEQDVRLRTALAWIDLYYAKRRLAQLQSLDEGLGDLQGTVSARLASGAARPSQALEPEQLRAVVKDRRSQLEAEAARAQARLASLTGDPDVDVLGDPPSVELDREKLEAGLPVLPRIAALDAGVQAADAETGLARSDKRPSWKVSASYGRRSPSYGDMVSLGVTIDLPLFPKRRQDPLIAAREGEADRARFMRIAGERDLRASFASDLADYDLSVSRLGNSRSVLVPLAKRRAELDMVSYSAGKLDLGLALLSTLALAEAEVEALSREGDVVRGAIKIKYTYGDVRP